MICHHYKCIFVHTPKTAGQSMEHVFLRLLNLDWETRAPLLLRPNDQPKLGPPRLAHLKADEYVRFKYLPQEMFDDYFKFAFVRNPWSRMVSMFRYLDVEKTWEFKSFLMHIFKNRIWKEQYWFVGPQCEFVCAEDGRVLMDFIGRFERLQIDFNHVCQKIDIPLTEVPHVNKAEINSFKRYQDFYDDESRQIVEELYRRDIDLFEYKFDQDM